MSTRREVITLLGGAAATPVLWQHSARALEPSGKTPRIGFPSESPE
jgi:hypothetical protein